MFFSKVEWCRVSSVVQDGKQELCEALKKDLGRSHFECQIELKQTRSREQMSDSFQQLKFFETNFFQE